MKPKNGTSCFFSEAKYRHWIGEDSHETRLLDRLKKVNVHLSSKQPSGPWFLSSTNNPVTQSHGSKLYKTSSSSGDHSVRTEPVTKTNSKDKIEILAEKLWSGVKCDSASGLVYRSDCINEDLVKKQSQSSTDISNKVTDYNYQQTTESCQDEVTRSINSVKVEADASDNKTEVSTEISVDNPEAKRSFVKPGFFYKDSEQVEDELSEHVETVSENTVEQFVDHTSKSDEHDVVNNSNVGRNKPAEQTDDKPSEDDGVDKKPENDSNKPGKCNLYELDPMFYNIKDR